MLINRFKGLLNSLRLSLRRFPVTIGISTLLTLSLIYYNEVRASLTTTAEETIIRINLILGMGILLSLCIALLAENFFNDKRKIITSYLTGLIALILYYIFLLRDFDFQTMTRYVGIMVFLVLGFFYIPVLGRKDMDYEFRIIDIFKKLFVTAVYSLVLLIGIFAILFTIDSLFNIDIDSKFYFYIFLVIFFIFAISYFLSKLPELGKVYEDSYPQALRVLLNYIVIPLISIYTLILYLYFAKILISWKWPKGLVSHLVIWYSSLSIGVIFLITPLLERDKISRYFNFLFPKLVLPVLVMMFLSIGQRIKQYGFTENRYFILVLGIWVTVMMLYFSIRRDRKNTFIPISLSLVVLISVLGPLSSFNISKYSQNKRLNDILRKNSMLSGMGIVKNPEITKEDQRQINNIIHYFASKHSLEDVKVLKDNFTTDQMEEVFGFKYQPDIWGIDSNERYFYYGLDVFNNPIEIQDYTHYIQLTQWLDDKAEVEVEDLKISGSKRLSISRGDNRGDKNPFIIDLEERAIEIVKKLNLEDKNLIKPDEMSVEIHGDMKVKIIFTNISGAEVDGRVEIRNLEYILLLDYPY